MMKFLFKVVTICWVSWFTASVSMAACTGMHKSIFLAEVERASGIILRHQNQDDIKKIQDAYMQKFSIPESRRNTDVVEAYEIHERDSIIIVTFDKDGNSCGGSSWSEDRYKRDVESVLGTAS